jgi:hypothetical protein
MLPGDFLQVSTSRGLVAQGVDDNSKGAGPRDRSRVSPALWATLVAQCLVCFVGLKCGCSMSAVWELPCYTIASVSMVKPKRCTNFQVYWLSLYMFRMVFPSIIRTPRLYMQHQVYVSEPVWHKPVSVCTVLDSWWWIEKPSETCRVIKLNKNQPDAHQF